MSRRMDDVARTLAPFRKEIDDLDDLIVEALGRRFDVIRRVAPVKRRQGIPMMQQGRIDEIYERIARLALRHRIDPEVLGEVYRIIVEASCELEGRLIAAGEEGEE